MRADLSPASSTHPLRAARAASAAPGYTLRQATVACAGVFIAIGVLALGSFNLGVLLLLGSFGSSAVMVFGFPDIHFSQPRSVIGGHVISSAVGLAALMLLGPSWWSLALAVAAALALMMLTRTVHPPAGSNPLIVFMAMPQWGFLLFPTLAGALAMVLIGVLYHRVGARRYPVYWR